MFLYVLYNDIVPPGPKKLMADLASMGDPGAVRPFTTHELAVVRSAAVAALARLGAFDLLGELAGGADLWLRLDIIRALADAGRPLDAFAADPEPQLRLEALRGGADPSRFLTDPDSALRRRALKRLIELRPEELPALLAQAVEDPVPEVRLTAARELAGCPDAYAVALARFLDDPDPVMRRLASDRIDALRDPAALLFARRLAPERLTPRLVAAPPRELLESHPDDVVELLLAAGEPWETLAAHPSAAVRRAVFDRTNDPIRFVDDPDLWRAATVKLMLAGCREPSMAGPYRRLAEDGDERAVPLLAALLGAEAVAPLARVSRRVELAVARELVGTDALAGLADTDDPQVLRLCAAHLTGPAALIPLIRAAGEIRGGGSSARLERYPEVRDPDFLIGALRHRRVSVQRFAAERLRGCDDSRAIEPLLAAADSESTDVQEAVVRALGKFAPREPRVSGRLIEFLTFGEICVRQAVCEVLGEQRVAAAVGPLTRVLVNRFLRPRAEAALRQIGDRRGLLSVLRRRRRDETIARSKAWIQERNQKRSKLQSALRHGSTR